MSNKVTLNEYEISASVVMHIMAKTREEALMKATEDLLGVVDDYDFTDCEAIYEHDELDLENTEETEEEDD